MVSAVLVVVCVCGVDECVGAAAAQSASDSPTAEAALEAAEIIAGLTDRLDWIVQQANAITGASQNVRKFRNDLPRDTWVVEQAAGVLTEDSVPGASRLPAAWRFLSGYAHGLLWGALGNQVVLSAEPDPVTGQIRTRRHGDINQLLDAAFFGLVIIEKAIPRFVDLCQADDF